MDVVSMMIQAEKARIRKLYGTKSPKPGLVKPDSDFIKYKQGVRKDD